MKTGMKKGILKGFCVLAAILFLVCGTLMTRDVPAGKDRYSTGNGAKTKNAVYAAAGDMSAAYPATETDYEEAPEEATAENGGDAQQRTEKIIRTVSFTLRTEDYDTVLDSVRKRTGELGGRVESLYVYGDTANRQARTAYLTLRIPKEQVDAFLSSAGELGRMTDYSENLKDISETYYDTQSRLAVQRAKLSRLQEMLPQAETVADIIEIENAISDTQYLVDTYETRMNGYNSRVDYSTVSVTVSEEIVREPENITLWDRIAGALRDSLADGVEFLADMLVFLVAALPWLILLALTVTVVAMLIRKRKRSDK